MLNSELAELINERIHSEKARGIMKRRLIDGVTFEALAEEVGMSTRGVKYLVQRNKKLIV